LLTKAKPSQDRGKFEHLLNTYGIRKGIPGKLVRPTAGK
jgi:hypothetical protein